MIFGCSLEHEKCIKSTFSLITEINNLSLCFSTIAVSGTIRTLEDKIIFHTWERLHWIKEKANEPEKAKIMEILEKCRPSKIRRENKEFKTDFEYFNKIFSSIQINFI